MDLSRPLTDRHEICTQDPHGSSLKNILSKKIYPPIKILGYLEIFALACRIATAMATIYLREGWRVRWACDSAVFRCLLVPANNTIQYNVRLLIGLT